MPRWLRVIRGMVGMGLTFAAAAGVFFGVIAVVLGLFFPGVEDELPFVIIAGSAWAFAIGVAFSGVLAIAARRLSFDKLSLPRVAALGAGGGLLLAGLLVAATWQEWSAGDALVPFTFLPLLGAGSATASLLLARRAGPLLASGEESRGRGYRWRHLVAVAIDPGREGRREEREAQEILERDLGAVNGDT